MTSVKRATSNQRERRGLAARPYIHASAILVVCAALGLAAAPAAAQDAAAEALFNQGRELMTQKKFAEACDKFQGSHELDPSVGALLNLADCREQNGQIASAWAAYREAASLARQRSDRKREQTAMDKAKKLEDRLSYLVIEVPAEARVNGMILKRNGEPVVSALWDEKVPVDPGKYVIRVEAPGYQPAEVAVDVEPRGGEARAQVPALEPASSAPDGPGARQPSNDQPEGTPGLTAEAPATDTGGMPTGRKIAIGAGAVGVVGLAAGVVLGLRASSLWDDARAECVGGDLDNCSDRGVSLSKDAQSSANLATVAFGVGVAAVAAGTVLWFLNPPAAEGDAEQAARIEPVFGPQAFGAQVTLRF
jgi:serine/threonine-protein kinase